MNDEQVKVWFLIKSLNRVPVANVDRLRNLCRDAVNFELTYEERDTAVKAIGVLIGVES